MGISAKINDFNSAGQWQKGVWVGSGTRFGVSIPNTPENLEAFKKGEMGLFAEGTLRKVSDLQVVGAHLSVWLEGSRLDPNKVGAPNVLRTPDVYADSANLVDEWLATSLSASVGTKIASWKGTRGTELVQRNALKQPTLTKDSTGNIAVEFKNTVLQTVANFSTQDDISVYALVSADKVTDTSTIVCQDINGRNRAWHLAIRNEKTQMVGFTNNSANGYSAYSGASVPLKDWTVVSGTRSRTAVGAYVNGTGGGVMDKVPDAIYTAPLTVGGRGDGLELLQGRVMAIRIYNGIHDAAMRAKVVQEMQSTVGKISIPVSKVDVPLVGINFSGAAHAEHVIPGNAGTEFQYAKEIHFKKWAEMDIRFVRLAFLFERIQPQMNGPLFKEHVDWLHSCFDLAEKYNMYILLNMHNYMRRRIGEEKYLIGTKEVPSAAFIDCWKRIATEFKGRKNLIGYGLVNEPYNTNGTWAGIAQRTIDAIRPIDPETDIYVAGDQYSSAVNWVNNNPAFPLKGNNLVYEAHQYFDSTSEGLYKVRQEVIPLDRGVERFTPFIKWCEQHRQRGFVGETGTPWDNTSAIACFEKAAKYLLSNKVPFTYFAGGPGWGESAVNAIEYNNTNPIIREPISVMKRLAGPTTRVIGPNA